MCQGNKPKPTCRTSHRPWQCHLHVAFCSAIVPKPQPLCSSTGAESRRGGSACSLPLSCHVCVFHIRSFCPKEAFTEATQHGLLTAFLATRGFKNLQMDQNSCYFDPSEDCKSLQKNIYPKESTNFLTHKWKGRSPTLPRKHPEYSKFFRFTPRGKQRTVRKSAMNSQSSLVFPDVFH